MTKVVEFKVGMTCGGCASAVNRILTKIKGVEKVEPNVETKYVKVTADDDVDTAEMLAALKKWSAASGKPVEMWV
jgi:copper chaperone